MLGLFDFGLALVFLFALAALIPVGVGLLNLMLILLDTSPIQLASYIAQAQSDPWGDGLWATLMLMSTLVPTFLHLTLAVVGAVIAALPQPTRVITVLKGADATRYELMRPAFYLTAEIWIGLALSVFVVWAALQGLGAISGRTDLLAEHLGGVALSVAGWFPGA